MNIQGLEFCSVIVIRDGVVFANELIVGKDHDAVEQKAESRFIDRVKEEDSELPTTKVVGFRFQQNALT